MNATISVLTLWSHTHTAAWRGLALARERGWVLAWDTRHVLHLFNHRGQRQAQWQAPAELADVACADDGGSFAAVGTQGQLWLLAPDLTVRWERRVPKSAIGVALEAFGQYLAVSDGAGTLHLFDRMGRTVWQALNARPLHFLAFIPEQPRVVVAADFGLTACYDSAGHCVWRDGLVAHVGSLAVNGDGSSIVLACFSEGLCCYRNGDPKTRQFAPKTAPTHRAAMSYDGKIIVTTDREDKIIWRNVDGFVRRELKVDGKPVSLAVDALGERAIVAFADGKIMSTEPRP